MLDLCVTAGAQEEQPHSRRPSTPPRSAGAAVPATAPSGSVRTRSGDDPLLTLDRPSGGARITGLPHLAVGGPTVELKSAIDYTEDGAVTHHAFAVSEPPGGSGSVTLTVEGDYGADFELATASAEGIFLGTAGFTEEDCLPATETFTLGVDQLSDLAADGTIQVDVTNSVDVGSFCDINRHTVVLRYEGRADPLDYGSILAGASPTRTLTLHNAGAGDLHVASIFTSLPEYLVSPASGVVPAGGSLAVTVTFFPHAPGTYDATLSIISDDPDTPEWTGALHGVALPAPFTVTPYALDVTLPTGASASRSVELASNAAGPLSWTASAGSSSLEEALARLDAGSSSLLAAIPGRFAFPGGETGSSLSDGRGHSFNLLSTPLGGLDYSDGVIRTAPAVGNGGRYFTRKYPGLFLFVADLGSVNQFKVDGTHQSLNINGARGLELVGSAGSVPYRGFVKGAEQYLHLVVVRDVAGLAQSFPPQAFLDTHVLTIPHTRRLYYLAFQQASDAQIEDLFSVLLQLLGADWLGVSPTSGTLDPAQSATLGISLDATRLPGGDYFASIGIGSAAPFEHEVSVPTVLRVVDVPDIALAGDAVVTESAIPFGQSGSTQHALPAPAPPAGGGTLSLLVNGFFPNTPASVSVTSEGLVLGAVTVSGGNCSEKEGVFPLDTEQLADLAADGTVGVRATNAFGIGGGCPLNQHRVRLTYPVRLDTLEIGDVLVGSSGSRAFTILNRGSADLHVSSITTGSADAVPAPASVVVTPGASVTVNVTYTPSSSGSLDGTLRVESDDPDAPVLSVPLHGRGLIPPDIEVLPPSVDGSAVSGQVLERTLTVRNTGGSDLRWHVAGSAQDLGHVLEALDAGFPTITGEIPQRFDFTEGETGNVIHAGGSNMYFNGNFLTTDLAGTTSIAYSNGLVTTNTAFGPGGRYFTRKYPGLFVMAADVHGAATFGVAGFLGVPGGTGTISGLVLQRTVGGVVYKGFVKRTWGTATPSVNHMVIVAERPGQGQSFPEYTSSDEHTVTLGGATRVYYLLYAAGNGGFIDDAATGRILDAFLALVGPGWHDAEPQAGVTPPGGESKIRFTLDASGFPDVDLSSSLAIASNDPVSPKTIVPVSLHVTGAADIALEVEVVLDSAMDFTSDYAVTTHDLPIPYPPLHGGTLDAAVDGNFDEPWEQALVLLDGTFTGYVGGSGLPCSLSSSSFPLTPQRLAQAVHDGVVRVEVRNNGSIPPICEVNRHLVTLRYPAAAPSLSFGDVTVGLESVRTVLVENHGTLPLVLGKISIDSLDVAATPSGSTVPPGGSVVLVLRYAPSSPGALAATLSIASNDPDEPVTTLPLTGIAFAPPDISVVPPVLEETLSAGQSVARALAIHNAGGLDLDWKLRAEPPPTLEEVLAAFDGGFERVTSAVPNRYDFAGGISGSSIVYGGAGMYVEGNDLNDGLPYSDGVIVPGQGGRYFTRKYPGLFVFAADVVSGSQFLVLGQLGSDRGGGYDTLQLERSAGGVLYRGFVKRVWGGNVASVNHLVIVEARTDQFQDIANDSDSDYHGVYLRSATRVYYFLFSTADGSYVDDETMGSIFERSLGLIAPTWLQPASASGTAPPGGVSSLPIGIGSPSSTAGDYVAHLVIESNDPDHPQVSVPAMMHVTGSPHLVLKGVHVDVDSTIQFEGQTEPTFHTLPAPLPAGGAGELQVMVAGRLTFGRAHVTAEGMPLGDVTGPPYCEHNLQSFPLSAVQLGTLIADGAVHVEVLNEFVIACAYYGFHRVRLIYDGPSESLDFGAVPLGRSRDIAVRITDPGTAPLHVSSISSDQGGFVPDAVSLTVRPGGEGLLTVSFSPPGVGTFEGTVTLASDDPEAPITTIHVQGAGFLAPDIVAIPETLDETLFRGQTVTRTVTLSNTGAGNLEWTLETDYSPKTGWLTATPTSGTVLPGESVEVAVGFDATELYAGEYNGWLLVRSNTWETPEIEIPVTLHVLDAPQIVLAGEPVAVSSSQGFGAPEAATTLALVLPVPARGPAQMELIGEGDFSDPDATASAFAEGHDLGGLFPSFARCVPTYTSVDVDAAVMSELAADGVVDVELRNSPQVRLLCSQRAHTVSLFYTGGVDPLDFETIEPVSERTLRLQVENHGTADLLVTSITSDRPEFVPAPAELTVPAGGSTLLEVLFRPGAEGAFDAVLTLTSNDPVRPVFTTSVRGEARRATFGVTPQTIEATLPASGAATRTLTVSNGSGVPMTVRSVAESASSLESVLASLDAGYATVTSVVPQRFDFDGGFVGEYIEDGGEDMYNFGNYLGTELGFLTYRDGTITTDAVLGPEGRYFTRKYPGLFVLAADPRGNLEFDVYGATGGSSPRTVDGAELDRTVGGVRYRAFVRRVYAGGVPSINHLVIVEDAPASQEFLYPASNDRQRVYLPRARRFYYLLFAGAQGAYIDDGAMAAVLDAFLHLLHPGWLSVSPTSAIVTAGASIDLTVALDAGDLGPGAHMASLVVTGDVTGDGSGARRTIVPVSLTICRAGHEEDCDDGDLCTQDACDAAAGCLHAALSCDDANPCTDDACDAASGCTHAANHASCSDENACTVGDACVDGACASGRPMNPKVDCDDHNRCTIESCDPEIGCFHSPVICRDSDPCTRDTCDPAAGCRFVPRPGCGPGGGNGPREQDVAAP